MKWEISLRFVLFQFSNCPYQVYESPVFCGSGEQLTWFRLRMPSPSASGLPGCRIPGFHCTAPQFQRFPNLSMRVTQALHFPVESLTSWSFQKRHHISPRAISSHPLLQTYMQNLAPQKRWNFTAILKNCFTLVKLDRNRRMSFWTSVQGQALQKQPKIGLFSCCDFLQTFNHSVEGNQNIFWVCQNWVLVQKVHGIFIN